MHVCARAAAKQEAIFVGGNEHVTTVPPPFKCPCGHLKLTLHTHVLTRDYRTQDEQFE